MDAIKSRKFHLWAVKSISEGIEILTGVPGGCRTPSGRFTSDSVFAKAQEKLHEMAVAFERFGREAGGNGNNKNDANVGNSRRKKR